MQAFQETQAPQTPQAPQTGTSVKAPPVRGDGEQLLILSGDPPSAELLTTTLELAGYRVDGAGNGDDAAFRLARRRYDLLVLDIALPRLHRLARQRQPVTLRLPILFLIDCDSLFQLLPGLGTRAAAEDYVTKPLRIPEVLARTRMLLRGRGPGSRPGDQRAPHYADLVLDDSTCQARRGPRPLHLTPAEYRLLRHLLVHAGQVLSKEQICRHVWGEFRAGNAIEKLVSRLRHKVDREGPALIHTRRGFGYWLGRRAAETSAHCDLCHVRLPSGN
ncbi:response regulator transcription factor [Streptomyces carpaticus]